MLLTFQLVCLFLFILLAVAFFSLFERKLMGLIQIRKGPNKVGPAGVLQPFADAMKLISKEETSPSSSIRFLYFVSPFIFFTSSSFVWLSFPVWWGLMSFWMSCVYILVLFSIGVYGLVFSGLYSNSKYASIGCVRAFVQTISYEVGLTLTVASLCLIYSSYSLSSILLLQEEVNLFIPFSPLMVILFIVLLAELNRSPFDLSEGESELVSGYSVEYGGLSYTVLFLSENMSIIWSSVVLGLFFSVYFIGVFIFLFVWVRATMPRVRLDAMLEMFWLFVLPILLGLCPIYVVIFY